MSAPPKNLRSDIIWRFFGFARNYACNRNLVENKISLYYSFSINGIYKIVKHFLIKKRRPLCVGS